MSASSSALEANLGLGPVPDSSHWDVPLERGLPVRPNNSGTSLEPDLAVIESVPELPSIVLSSTSGFRPAPRSELYEVLQSWEGIVASVHRKKGRFSAELHDKTGQEPVVLGEFDIEEVSRGDRPLLAEGAVFYASVAYEETPGGQRRRVFEMKFRRLPAWSDGDLRRAAQQAQEWAEFLND